MTIQLEMTLPDGEKPEKKPKKKKEWPELTQELLHTLVRIDAETGDIFALKEGGGRWPTSRKGKIGRKLGCLVGRKNDLRLATRINGAPQYNSRLVWLYFHGYLPPKGRVIDHINRNPLDNRLANLRDVSNKENSRNRTLSKNNTSGHAGVSLLKGERPRSWLAYVSLDCGKQINRAYETYEEACIAADAMRAEAYGEHAPR